MDFREQYGPWALVAGASEGVGSALAVELGRRGLNVVLLARRQRVVEEVAAAIEAESGVQTRALAVDLAEPGAARTVHEATVDIDVGLLAYNAGADAEYRPFLARPVESALSMIQRNCAVPTELCHRFAPAMVARGRGGIVLVTSAAAFGGAPNMAAYGGSKAYDLVFAEGLWTELKPQGVDVLSLVLGETDTPALRRLRAQRGLVDDPDQPIPGAASVDEVVADALEQLPNGPTRIVGESLRQGLGYLGTLSRNEIVATMVKASAAAMAESEAAAG